MPPKTSTLCLYQPKLIPPQLCLSLPLESIVSLTWSLITNKPSPKTHLLPPTLFLFAETPNHPWLSLKASSIQFLMATMSFTQEDKA